MRQLKTTERKSLQEINTMKMESREKEATRKIQIDLEIENVYISVESSSPKANGELNEGRNLHISQQY